jgi:hypothetical protein
MKKILSSLACFGLWSSCTFAGTLPHGWVADGSALSSYDMGVQQGTRMPGDNNAYIKAIKDSSGFGTLMQTISADAYRNQRVRLSGYLKTSRAGWAGLWMRIDSADHHIVLDNMQDRGPRGDSDWQKYSVVLDVPESATALAYGFLLNGQGEVLADNFTLEVVGKDVPVTATPWKPRMTAPTNMNFSP